MRPSVRPTGATARQASRAHSGPLPDRGLPWCGWAILRRGRQADDRALGRVARLVAMAARNKLENGWRTDLILEPFPVLAH
jgi:hypothetical protein